MYFRYIITGFTVLLSVVSTKQISQHSRRYRSTTAKGRPGDTDGSISRIVNGWNARKYEYPWNLVLYYGVEFVCGAVLISENIAITAAHCVDTDRTQTHRTFEVVAGLHKLDDGREAQLSTVDFITLHPQYDQESLRNDIAILHLKSAFNITKSVKPVPISDFLFDASAPNNRQCYTSGFGVITQSPSNYPQILQKLKVNVIDNLKCRNRLKKYKDALINLRTICTMNINRAACYGDSGGPMGCYDQNGVYRLVGLVSWGPEESCVKGPSIYIRVSRYRTWLRRTTGQQRL